MAIYFEIDGAKGDSKDDTHTGWIDVDSFSWGGESRVDMYGGQMARGGAQVQPITLSCVTSSVSGTLLNFLLEGVPRATAKLHITMQTGSTEPWLTIDFTAVTITSVHQTHDGSGGSYDSVSFVFKKAKQEIADRIEDTGELGAKVVFEVEPSSNVHG